MDEHVYWLLTYYYDHRLLHVALRFHPSELSAQARMYPLEQDSQEEIKGLLPQHCHDLGPLVEVQDIFLTYETTR